MNDWSNYIEREVVEVLPELEALGYRLESDEPGIGSYRNIVLQKGDESLELICLPLELEEYEARGLSAEDANWFVDDIFEGEASYQACRGAT